MMNYGCWWWWLLLGGLVGWLASWWLGRKRAVTVERVVEKIVDRPVEVIVEKVVEKIVDRPVDRPVDRIVDRVVDRIVEKPVDNPVQLDRIRALEAEVSQMAGLRATVSSLQQAAASRLAPAEPAAVNTLVSATPAKLPELPPMPPVQPVAAAPAAPDKPASKIMDRALDRLLDRQAAVSAGFSVRGMDDLEIIEGIGPKIAGLFKAEGIRMFSELAQTPQLRMQAILDRAGPSFRLANPSTWARQADLAANNKWDMLRTLQDELSAGVDKSDKGAT